MGEVIDARILFEERRIEVEIERRDYSDLLTKCMAGDLPCDVEPRD